MDHKGQPIGSPNINSTIDSIIYKLEFHDGRVEENSVNIVIENILDQIRSNDWDRSLFNEMMSVRKRLECSDQLEGRIRVLASPLNSQTM